VSPLTPEELAEVDAVVCPSVSPTSGERCTLVKDHTSPVHMAIGDQGSEQLTEVWSQAAPAAVAAQVVEVAALFLQPGETLVVWPPEGLIDTPEEHFQFQEAIGSFLDCPVLVVPHGTEMKALVLPPAEP
jgi:hypothetical protein